jgi:hypothetical protein
MLLLLLLLLLGRTQTQLALVTSKVSGRSKQSYNKETKTKGYHIYLDP